MVRRSVFCGLVWCCRKSYFTAWLSTGRGELGKHVREGCTEVLSSQDWTMESAQKTCSAGFGVVHGQPPERDE